MAFEKAKKEQIWLKILLNGPSGSGKTYSALRMATGIANASGGKVAAIDTENRRIRYYADEFNFDDMTLEDPYSPEKYVEAIEEACAAGYNVLIIDSLSHEWSYCLDLVNNMPGTNTYTKWKTVTPRHDAFKEKILQSPIHIIATVRGKDEYVLQDENGKKVPKKVGMGYSQRDGLEFDYTVTLNIDQDTHRYSAAKDNSHLFEGRFDVITEKDGEALFKWANNGAKTEKKPKTVSPAPASGEETLEVVITKIDQIARELPTIGAKKTDVAAKIKSTTNGIANYNSITDINVAKTVLAELEKMKKGFSANE